MEHTEHIDLSAVSAEALMAHLTQDPAPLTKEQIRHVWLILIQRLRQTKTGGRNGGRPAKQLLTLTVDGKKITKSVIEWSRETGIPRPTILHRLEIGATPEEALSKVLRLGSDRNREDLGKKKALQQQQRGTVTARQIANTGLTKKEQTRAEAPGESRQ